MCNKWTCARKGPWVYPYRTLSFGTSRKNCLNQIIDEMILKWRAFSQWCTDLYEWTEWFREESERDDRQNRPPKTTGSATAVIKIKTEIDKKCRRTQGMSLTVLIWITKALCYLEISLESVCAQGVTSSSRWTKREPRSVSSIWRLEVSAWIDAEIRFRRNIWWRNSLPL